MVLCIVGLFLYTITFHYRMPHMDNLDLLTFIEQTKSGQMSIKELFKPHGGSHWHAITYALLIPIAIASKWMTIWGTLLSVLFSIATFIIIHRQLSDIENSKKNSRLLSYGIVVISLFIFSLDQASNWLEEWQLAVFINLFGTVSAIALLSKRPIDIFSFFLAILSSVIAIYNFSTGIAILPVGVYLLAVSRITTRNQKKTYLLLWILFSIVISLHFYFDIVSTSSHSRLSMTKFYLIPIYALKFISSPLACNNFTNLALPIGGGGLVLFAWIILQLKRASNKCYCFFFWIISICNFCRISNSVR